MITNLIYIFQTPLQTGTETGSDKWSLYLFICIVAVCAALFIYFLRRTDKLVKNEIVSEHHSTAKHPIKTKDLHGEEAAAIALAIHLYQSEIHDMESFKITMQKVSRIYSPWSSKIYTLRQYPR